MATPSAEALARSYFDAVHDGDLDKLAGLFAEDATVYFPVRDPVVGREAIRSFYADVFKLYATRTDDCRRIFRDSQGNVAVEISFVGKLGSGKEVAFEAVDLFTAKDGRIQELRIFYDSVKVMRMLGTLPSQ